MVSVNGGAVVSCGKRGKERVRASQSVCKAIQMMIRWPLVVLYHHPQHNMSTPLCMHRVVLLPSQAAMLDWCPCLSCQYHLDSRSVMCFELLGSKWWVCEVDLSSVPEFQSGLTKTWRRRVSEGSSWQTAACACLRTWYGNTCKRREEVTFDGWTCLHVQWKCHVTWVSLVGGRLLRFWGWHGSVTFFLYWSSLRGQHSCLFFFKRTIKTASCKLIYVFVFFHLVRALLSALLVYEGEGLPADFGSLTWWALTSFKDSPFWWEPPVKDGLKLCPLDGAQKNHGFYREC